MCARIFRASVVVFLGIVNFSSESVNYRIGGESGFAGDSTFDAGGAPSTPSPYSSLKEKLIKIGAKVVSHGRYVAFQMAEVAIPRSLFADILRLIAELRPPLALSTA